MSVQLRVLENPVLSELLLRLRDKTTPPSVFRETMEQIGVFIAYEIARELPLVEERVETPLGVAAGRRPRDEDVVLIGVLRAALPLVYGMARVLRRASIGFVSAKRLEETGRLVNGVMVFDVEVSYINIPVASGKRVYIVDPMLATASTIIHVARRVREEKPGSIHVVSLIASKPGLERLSRELGDIVVYTIAVDERLDQRGFIVPGLGDAGDRAFNT